MASLAPTATPPAACPPNRFWTLTEGRAFFELGAFLATSPLMSLLPKGDGHPVVVLPGFMATNTSTAPMRRLLCRLGYDARGWESGRNVLVNEGLIGKLERQLETLHEQTGQTISLVGWSLGGVLARELAKMNPDIIRIVVSLGSPISDDRGHTNAARLFQFFNGDAPEKLRNGQFSGLGIAPPVPTTSIFTKSDGVVHWRGSVQDAGAKIGDHPTENIEVYASHCGLGVNPSVMIALADRLAQPEGEWQPFEAKPHQRLMFPKVSLH